MKIAIFISQFSLSPRVIKIRNSIFNNSTEIRIIAWDRNNNLVKEEGEVLASPFFKQYYENLLDGKFSETIFIHYKLMETQDQAINTKFSNN